jgi:hypothetical protein
MCYHSADSIDGGKRETTNTMMAPGSDVSVAKKILIPATVAFAIGVAGLGGLKHTGERICSRAEMCQPEKIRLPDRHDPEPSILLQGQVSMLAVPSTTASLPSNLSRGSVMSPSALE